MQVYPPTLANLSSMTRLALLLFLLFLTLAPLARAQTPTLPPSYAPTLRPSPSKLRSDLTQILARSEYAELRQSALLAKLRDLLERLRQWWRDHFGGKFEALHEMSPALYWTITALGLLIVTLLLYHIYITMRSAFGHAPRRRAGRDRLAPPEVFADPDTLLSQADHAAAEGNFPEALRRLYLALIRRLDRQGALRYDRSFTNHDYLRQLRAAPAHAPLSTLTATAERVWYGHRDLALSQYHRLRDLALTAWHEGDASGPQ